MPPGRGGKAGIQLCLYGTTPGKVHTSQGLGDTSVPNTWDMSEGGNHTTSQIGKQSQSLC
jgi:hypothetical protein